MGTQKPNIWTMKDFEMSNISPGGRVVVAMSGGVDSSTAAALMVESGYDVVGVTLQLYDHGEATKRKGACCAGQDILDARRVAETLNIPHYVLDYEDQFREAVVEDFADSYLRGETPIPCIRCNQTVKFRDLLAVAKDLDGECLVTGHYVRHKQGPDGVEMHRAADSAKDQSYFLYATTRDQLEYLRFPLGGLSKSATRRHASRFNLPVAEKPDSQDICFVPEGHYTKVVQKFRPEAWKAGDIVDLEGNVIGRHEGVVNFTVGQRRGLGVAAPYPLYVVKIDPDKNEVVAGPKEALAKTSITVDAVNWIGPGDVPPYEQRAEIKIRSNSDPDEGFLRYEDEVWTVDFDVPQMGVAPGQAAVFYRGNRVLGGGWIQR